MSERKVLNKYYPPDFDPSKIPRARQSKNRQFTVRLMAPCNMRCNTCGEYIYKGKKFNARKEDVENESYLGIRIYRFYIKCTRCLAEISFKTDPVSTDYIIEAGATRNFMALKLAEEQAEREERAEREEEAMNPMKLLEKRTQASRNEMNALEALEELKELNQRQVTPAFETMLEKYDVLREQEAEREKREEEEFIRAALTETKSKFVRRIENEDSSDEETPIKKSSLNSATDHLVSEKSVSSKPISEPSIGLLKVNKTMLVKRKVAAKVNAEPNNVEKQTQSQKITGLSLLGGYSSDSD